MYTVYVHNIVIHGVYVFDPKTVTRIIRVQRVYEIRAGPTLHTITRLCNPLNCPESGCARARVQCACTSTPFGLRNITEKKTRPFLLHIRVRA